MYSDSIVLPPDTAGFPIKSILYTKKFGQLHGSAEVPALTTGVNLSEWGPGPVFWFHNLRRAKVETCCPLNVMDGPMPTGVH